MYSNTLTAVNIIRIVATLPAKLLFCYYWRRTAFMNSVKHACELCRIADWRWWKQNIRLLRASASISWLQMVAQTSFCISKRLHINEIVKLWHSEQCNNSLTRFKGTRFVLCPMCRHVIVEGIIRVGTRKEGLDTE